MSAARVGSPGMPGPTARTISTPDRPKLWASRRSRRWPVRCRSRRVLPLSGRGSPRSSRSSHSRPGGQARSRSRKRRTRGPGVRPPKSRSRRLSGRRSRHRAPGRQVPGHPARGRRMRGRRVPGHRTASGSRGSSPGPKPGPSWAGTGRRHRRPPPTRRGRAPSPGRAVASRGPGPLRRSPARSRGRCRRACRRHRLRGVDLGRRPSRGRRRSRRHLCPPREGCPCRPSRAPAVGPHHHEWIRTSRGSRPDRSQEGRR